ncbi:hypothetical protein Tco_1363252 [Tanacetum coccineum]
MAKSQRQADAQQDELCPPNKHFALMDANKKIDLDNPLKELTMTLDDFRMIFQLPQATNNNYKRFVAAPKLNGSILPKQSWFYTGIKIAEGSHYSLKHPSTLIPYPRFTKIIVSHYMTAYPKISRRVHDKYHNLEHDEMVKIMFNSGKNQSGVGMKIPSWMITDKMKLTENDRIYVVVLGIAEKKSRNDFKAKQMKKKVKEHLMAEETEKLVEGTENIEKDKVDNSILNSQNDPGTRLEPMIYKESLKVEKIVVVSQLVNVIEEEDELADDDYVLRRREREGGRYGYLFGHLKTRFLARKKFNVLAQHLQEVMEESLPKMDDPHDDVHPKGENNAKRQKTSEHGTYVFGESSYGQDNESELGPSTSELVKEMSQIVYEAKLCKVVDEMLRQRFTLAYEHQYHIAQMQNFLKNDIIWENIKDILSLPFLQKPTTLIQSCQRDLKAPTLSLVYQDLLYLKKGNSGLEKIVLSLPKFLAVTFHDDDIKERTSKWVDKCVNKRAMVELGSITEPDYNNLNKNDIEDMYLLCINNKSKRRICFPSNTAYSDNSIRRTDIQQTYTANSNQLNTAYLSSDTELGDNTFSGSEHEDANEHIEKVLEIVDLFHIPKVTQDQIMLRAFPVSLTGAASRWLRNQTSRSVTTWEVLKTKFLNKYCPPACTAKKIEEINNFQQEPDESLFRAWERFEELLMKCPQHYLTDIQEVILFYNGLDVPTRQILDSKGAIPSKAATDAKIAIQKMAEYSQKWNNGTSSRTKMYAAQVGCELCKGPHYTKDCPQKEEGKTLEEAYYTQFGAPYQPGGQYRAAGPGFYQRNNGKSSYPDQRPSLEELLNKFMAESAKRHEENSNIIKEIRASTDAAIRNQGASIKTLEIQIGQMSKVLQERGFRSLPSFTKTNPRDQVKSISTAKADFSEIRHIGRDPYAVSGTQHRSIWSKTVPFPERLLNFGCNDWREAQDVKILDAYNRTLP